VPELEEERDNIIKQEDELHEEIIDASKSSTTATTTTEQASQIVNDTKLLHELEGEQHEVEGKIDGAVKAENASRGGIDDVPELEEERDNIIKQEDELHEEIIDASKSSTTATSTTEQATSVPVTSSLGIAQVMGMMDSTSTADPLWEEDSSGSRRRTTTTAASPSLEDEVRLLHELKDEEKEVDAEINDIVEGPGNNVSKSDGIADLEGTRNNIIDRENEVREEIAHLSSTTTLEEVSSTTTTARNATADFDKAEEIEKDLTVLHGLKDEEKELDQQLDNIVTGEPGNDSKTDEVVELEDERNAIIKEEQEIQEEIAEANATAMESSVTFTTSSAISTTQNSAPGTTVEAPWTKDDITELHELKDEEQQLNEEIDELSEATGGNSSNDSEHLEELEDERQEIIKQEQVLEEEIGNQSGAPEEEKTTVDTTLGQSSTEMAHMSTIATTTAEVVTNISSHVPATVTTSTTLNVQDNETDDKEYAPPPRVTDWFASMHHHRGPRREVDVITKVLPNGTQEVINNSFPEEDDSNDTMQVYLGLQDAKDQLIKHELEAIREAHEDADKIREIDNMEEQLVEANSTTLSGPAKQAVEELHNIHVGEQYVVNEAPCSKDRSSAKAASQHTRQVLGEDTKTEDEVFKMIVKDENHEQVKTTPGPDEDGSEPEDEADGTDFDVE